MKNAKQSTRIRALLLGVVMATTVHAGIPAQGNAPAQTPNPHTLRLVSANTEDPLRKPMQFSWYRACEGNACPSMLLAQGVITADTPKKFEAFVQDLDHLAVIWLNSPGGDLAAGIKLGRLFRKRGYSTVLGDPSRDSTGGDEVLWTTGICYSACSYAFLGGTRRWIAEHGGYGVHQFYGSGDDIGQSAAQVGMTTLAEYLDEMGVDRKLLDIASRTIPKEIKEISLKAARTLNIDNTDPPKAAWLLKADAQGRLSLSVVQRQAERDGVMAISLRYESSRLIADVAYRINQTSRSEKELLEIFSDDSGLKIDKNAMNSDSIPFGRCQSWARSAKGNFLTHCELDREALAAMLNRKKFSLYVEWANAVRDVAPIVEFGTQDLEGGLKALLKN